jgi:hypothetical protein
MDIDVCGVIDLRVAETSEASTATENGAVHDAGPVLEKRSYGRSA